MKKSLWIFAGALFSAILLFYLLETISWRQFWAAIINVDVSWIILASIAFSVSVGLRAVRFSILIGGRRQDYGSAWTAMVFGYLGNFIYPLRAGEIIRVVTINRLLNVPLGKGAASAVLDRTCDALILGFCLTVVVFMHRDLVPELGPLWRIAVGLSISFCFVVILMFWGGWFESWVLSLSKILPKILSERVPIWYSQGIELFRNYRRIPKLLPILVLTLLAFVFDFIFVWVMLRAFGWLLPFSAAFTLEVLLLVGSALPSAPGYIGIFQLASVLALSLYGIDTSEAIAFSIVYQVVALTIISSKAVLASYLYKTSISRINWRSEKFNQ